MKKNKFNVEGIHCGSCVNKIETAFQTLEGLESSSINKDSGEVVTESQDSLSPMSIKKCIEELGFKVNGFSKI
ncbi:MAG: heavy metal transporter [Halobacteriovoraceae bacterium]|mgnify:CR=1 FL=1|jgi:copper chaperone|nr:heavy metal transporter [Halobacteriovoraceae bacterium]MBC97318.1 heavy metal transporter [Halobacteriovoraceae bacterium]|tara:strand:- start:39912 stop:40130 length:219 start_codon:yes stop_codon:yes gene_type:complete